MQRGQQQSAAAGRVPVDDSSDIDSIESSEDDDFEEVVIPDESSYSTDTYGADSFVNSYQSKSTPRSERIVQSTNPLHSQNSFRSTSSPNRSLHSSNSAESDRDEFLYNNLAPIAERNEEYDRGGDYRLEEDEDSSSERESGSSSGSSSDDSSEVGDALISYLIHRSPQVLLGLYLTNFLELSSWITSPSSLINLYCFPPLSDLFMILLPSDLLGTPNNLSIE